MNPKDDPTSLGSILISMGAVTETQLLDIIEKQRQIREETLLGFLFVHHGYCTKQQLDIAVSAQISMRSKSKMKRALAFADLALSRNNRKAVYCRVVDQVEKIAQKMETGDFPKLIAKVMASDDENGG